MTRYRVTEFDNDRIHTVFDFDTKAEAERWADHCAQDWNRPGDRIRVEPVPSNDGSNK
jgi:hypothetical protein